MFVFHPWALVLGASALILPVVVHWLTRPRPRRLALSTLRFVREVVQQRRAAHRLRDWLILTLRVLAVAMLAGMFARPYFAQRRIYGTDSPGEVARVIIVDASHSMSAVARGVEVFERARSLAGAQLVDQAGLRADVILAGAQAQRVFEGLSANLAGLRLDLSQARPRPERCDTARALRAAADILGKAPADKQHRREVMVFTDLQRTNWQAADYSVLPADASIEIQCVAPGEAMANLAVVRAGANGRAEPGRPTKIEVEVANDSRTPREVTVDLTTGASVQKLNALCPAGGSVVLRATCIVSQAGWTRGEARLVGVEDAIAADNVRCFAIETRPRASYGLLSREAPSRETGGQRSSSYYLEAALSPQRSGENVAGAQVVRMVPPLSRETLSGIDLVVLSRPGRLDDEVLRRLVAAMQRGKPLVYVACEATDAANLKRMAQFAGADLRLPVDFVPPSVRTSRQSRSLAQYRVDLPPFSVFGSSAAAALDPLRFAQALDTPALAGGLRDDVLARYDDNTAAVVWTTCGAGALVVLNVDLAASNLPQSPAFVPLVGEVVDHLLSGRDVPRALPCGEPVVIELPAELGAAANLRLRSTREDSPDTGELLEEPTGVVWRWPAAGPPGVYEVIREGKAVMAVATGVPAEECDLRPLEEGELREQAVGGRIIHDRAWTARDQQRDVLWTWFGVACVVCMLVELMLLRAFKT